MRNNIQPVPAPNLFVREDVSKPENRINLALFGVMSVLPFRCWFFKRLELDEASEIYPPQNVIGGRPDFVVVGADGKVAAWIEVELGGENVAQLATFRDSLPATVKSIVGLESTDGHLSLEEIARRIRVHPEYFDRQQARYAGVLTELITQLAHPPVRAVYKLPGTAVRQVPLIADLADRLGDKLTFEMSVMPGKVQVATMSKQGWTIRVYSTEGDKHSVRLMSKATANKFVKIPALIHLNHYLPHAPQAIAAYAAFMRGIGVEITGLGFDECMPVEEEKLLAQAARLAECLGSLALAYGGVTPVVSIA